MTTISAYCALLIVTFPLIDGYILRGSSPKQPGYPVVLVPGDGGSQLQAKLTNKTHQEHYWCETHTDYWFELWLNIQAFSPLITGCWMDNMSVFGLEFNKTTGRTSAPQGVSVRVPGWGNTSTVEWLDASHIYLSDYFNVIVKNTVNWGYRRAKSIRGAPFDFRRAPNEFEEYYTNLKKLIEKTYYNNNNKRVVTIGHSMGNPTIIYFFNQMTQDWKDKFIRSHISVSGPYGGSVKVLKLYASGYNLGAYSWVVRPLAVRPAQRSFPSSAFMMPSYKYHKSDEALVITAKRNYTVRDYRQFFTDIGYPIGWDMFQATGNHLSNLEAPGVEVHCIYGVGLPTPKQLVYGKGYFPDYQPTDVNGDGDGTVGIESLQGCKKWRQHQKQLVHEKEISKGDHIKILKNPELVAYIKGVLYN